MSTAASAVPLLCVCGYMCICVRGVCVCVCVVEGEQGQTEEACRRGERKFYDERPLFPFHVQGYQVIEESIRPCCVRFVPVILFPKG